MGWVEDIGEAVKYIEDNITQELKMEQIAKRACVSSFYFQKGFAMLCGFTVKDYIRQRRLSLAGSELASTDERVIDIALKYGYDSPDSFTKAFTRFHGATPTAVRRDGAMVKSFAPLKIKFRLEGGYIMDYKIVKKDAFTVAGLSGVFSYERAVEEVPAFWQEYFQNVDERKLCGLYGINIDEDMSGDEFEYMIADNYSPTDEMPDGYATRVIPAHTWAVFPCKGPMPERMAEVNRKIFSEWLPNNAEYQIAEGYNIEMYTDVTLYPKGNRDENYYSEIWIPVRKK